MKQYQSGMFVPHLLLQMHVLILGQEVQPEAKGGRKFSLAFKKPLPKERTISKINKVAMEASSLQVNHSFPQKRLASCHTKNTDWTILAKVCCACNLTTQLNYFQ